MIVPLFKKIPRPVGRLGLELGLGSGPHVVGRLGSGMGVSASFHIILIISTVLPS